MRDIYINSTIYLKSGDIVKTTLQLDETDFENVTNLEAEVKEKCKMLAKFYIGVKEGYTNIAYGSLEVIKGTIAFRPENVYTAVVTYEIVTRFNPSA